MPHALEDNVINTKFVFKVKEQDDNTIEHYKA